MSVKITLVLPPNYFCLVKYIDHLKSIRKITLEINDPANSSQLSKYDLYIHDLQKLNHLGLIRIKALATDSDANRIKALGRINCSIELPEKKMSLLKKIYLYLK